MHLHVLCTLIACHLAWRHDLRLERSVPSKDLEIHLLPEIPWFFRTVLPEEERGDEPASLCRLQASLEGPVLEGLAGDVLGTLPRFLRNSIISESRNQ